MNKLHSMFPHLLMVTTHYPNPFVKLICLAILINLGTAWEVHLLKSFSFSPLGHNHNNNNSKTLILESLRNHFEMILGSFRDPFGIMFGMNLGLFWDDFSIILG